MHGNLLYAEEAFRIRGAVFEVYRRMGAGFLEGVYQDCLAIEFEEQAIPFKAAPSITLEYKGRRLKHRYAPDFICFDRVIVELKAARENAPEHRARTVNYLPATGLQLGLLVNFGTSPQVKIERFAL